MKNVQAFGTPPAVRRIVRIIVTSAEGEGLLFSGGENKAVLFDPTGSPLERGEGNKEDPLTFRLTLNEG